MTEAEYLPYEIRVSQAERWMERPIKIEFIAATPTGSSQTTLYLDEQERDALIAALTDQTDRSV